MKTLSHRLLSLGLIVCVGILSVSCQASKKAKAAYSDKGVQASLAVATSEPLASQAAIDIFRVGGNIADAAVAASLAISVLRPQSTGLGGGGFLVYVPSPVKNILLSKAVAPKAEAWDFREVAPGAATPTMYVRNGKADTSLSQTGALAVGVPGLIAGLWDFHKRHGVLSWAQVCEPAIRLAAEGVPVSAHLARAIERRRKDLEKSPELSKLLLPFGTPLREGDRLVQFDLAESLRKIAAGGKKEFYRGSIAQTISSWSKENGGILNARDFQRYRVRERSPLEAEWRGLKVITMPPPSSGGLHLIQILKTTDALLKRPTISLSGLAEANHVMLEIEAFKRAYADRAMHLGDPDFHIVPVKELLADSYLSKRAAEIRRGVIIPGAKVTPWSRDMGGKQTSHLSFMDSEGNVISTTQTVNTLFGAAVMAPGTGIVLNNEMDDFSIQQGVANAYGLVGGQANEIRPRKRPLSSMMPTVVVGPNGEPLLALGAPGGSRIITSVYVTMSRLLRDGLSPEDAISGCRFHHQWVPDKVFLEAQCSEAVKAELRKAYTVEETPEFGEVQMVGRDREGRVFAVTDPRGHGKGVISSVGP